MTKQCTCYTEIVQFRKIVSTLVGRVLGTGWPQIYVTKRNQDNS